MRSLFPILCGCFRLVVVKRQSGDQGHHCRPRCAPITLEEGHIYPVLDRDLAFGEDVFRHDYALPPTGTTRRPTLTEESIGPPIPRKTEVSRFVIMRSSPVTADTSVGLEPCGVFAHSAWFAMLCRVMIIKL